MSSEETVERNDQTEREALERVSRNLMPQAWGIIDQMSEPARQEYLSRMTDAMKSALETEGFHRTPTPHVVTTAEELGALPTKTIVRSAAGTVACRHSEFFGVVFGDERPFRWDLLALPATVLTPAPAPVDREALVEKVAEVVLASRIAMNGYFRDSPEDVARAVLDAIEGVDR